jgi:hypothetical protein
VNRKHGESRGVKKIGGRKVIHSQIREMVINVALWKIIKRFRLQMEEIGK